jgi:hypothetical protein
VVRAIQSPGHFFYERRTVVNSKTVGTVKVGAREIRFDLTTLVRIEQRTGLECGEIVAKLSPERPYNEDELASLPEAELNRLRVAGLRRMGGVTFAMKFVGAALGVGDKVVESDHGQNLLEVFGEMVGPFSDSVAFLFGVREDDKPKADGDQDGDTDQDEEEAAGEG